MPFVEKQEHGGHSYYYLVKSVRVSPAKVRKVRVFLGRQVPPKSRIGELLRELERKAPKRYVPRLLGPRLAEQLDDLRVAISTVRATPLEALPEDFLVRFTYNTNAIEGNPLTLRQTALLLIDGITPEGIRAENAIEALNARDAWEFVRSFKGILNRGFVCKVQYLVTKQTSCRIQGNYRDREVRIAGSSWTPPTASRVPAEMERLFRKFRSERVGAHPVERAALLHDRIVRVHPFTDGNGRTARLLMNWTLMKGKFPPVIIEARNKEAYYTMIETGDAGNDAPFARFLARQLLDQYSRASTEPQRSSSRAEDGSGRHQEQDQPDR